MSDLGYPSWQEHVRLAVLEPNPQKLKVKIAAGRQAIEDRRAQLSGDHNTRDERIALDDALQTLQVLSRYLAA